MSNSKHWFTTSFLQGGRCRKAMLGVCVCVGGGGGGGGGGIHRKAAEYHTTTHTRFADGAVLAGVRVCPGR